MSLKATFIKLRDDYVIHQAQSAKLPEFAGSQICRRRITFSGRVQKVGFRLEVCELAKRLGLTGFCKNLSDGRVQAELQGPEEKICFLVTFMETLKRVKITEKLVEEMEVVDGEADFISC